MRLKNSIYLIFFFVLIACQDKFEPMGYTSEHLLIKQITANTFVHTSFLATDSYGKVPCNGMIVINNGEALVFDTPVYSKDSKALIDWITDDLSCELKGVVATHFHNDCLGSLDVFHSYGIPSYASAHTVALAKKDSLEFPQHTFQDYKALTVGTTKVINTFVGEGHSKDNIVCYFPDDKVLFGGCLVKELGAGKGYLGDANVVEWPRTIKKLKDLFSDAEVVIPGHGNPGDLSLLDYTINLFEKTEESK